MGFQKIRNGIYANNFRNLQIPMMEDNELEKIKEAKRVEQIDRFAVAFVLGFIFVMLFVTMLS